MYFFNNINIICDGQYKNNMSEINQVIGYIKNNLKLDNLDLHKNTKEFKSDSDIYKIFHLLSNLIFPACRQAGIQLNYAAFTIR